MIQDWLEGVRGTLRGRAILGFTLVVVAALVWAAMSLVLPWSDGIVPTVQGLLALELPWAPVPAPDGVVATRNAGLGTAAVVAAPLLIAVFWLAAAYHLDHAARRVFGASQVPGVRHSAGYTVMAVAVVFPLLVLGLVAGAWGIFALITWASALSAWGSAAGLVAVLAAFASLVRLANAVLDHRAAGG